jgi:hypothetical protein
MQKMGSVPAFADAKEIGAGTTVDALVMGIDTKDFWGVLCTSITSST